ncbi:DUF1534 domain-containing protein [Pseudomonas syringae]|nr:DUF1534 domain-containing protein [Pseudomonas syringae]
MRTLQRGDAFGEALRHSSGPHRFLKGGRGASRTACDAERRTIVQPATYRCDSYITIRWYTSLILTDKHELLLQVSTVDRNAISFTSLYGNY